MSDSTKLDSGSEHITDATHADIHPVDEHHPTPREYVQIAVVLAVLTAMEIAASYVALPHWVFLSLLIILMTLKFAFVAGWFMHLRFDTRLYSRLMMTGLIGAISLYAIVLLVFAGAGGEI